MDFASADGNGKAIEAINSDVSQATGGMIPNLFDNIDPKTILILVNAIYFKALWKSPFNVKNTEPDNFRLDSGQVITTPMMYGNRRLAYFEDSSGTKAVRLDYREGSLAMVLILPPEGMSLRTYIQSHLTKEMFQTILNGLYKSRKVQLKIPRFRLESSIELIPQLKALGIQDIFDQKRANLSKISSGSIFVSEVIQKAVIQCDERGTEAAVATAVVKRKMKYTPHVKFTADRPFLFALVGLDEVQKEVPKSEEYFNSDIPNPKILISELMFIGTVENPQSS